MGNKMKEVCALFGLRLGEPFALVTETGGYCGFINPYHFTNDGLVDGAGAVVDSFLVGLLVGSFKAIKLPSDGSEGNA